MTERSIKPSELDIGMRFRLTGDAEDAHERDMANHVYEVTNVDTASTMFAHLLIKDETTGEEIGVTIAPWAPLILIEP